MILTLKRGASAPNSTPGQLFIDGVFECYTLEDVVRPKKIAGKTAISTGTYKITIDMSNRFKRLLPLVNNVPEFVGVRIHPGNTHEDTEGCILVGTGVRGSDFISSSKVAFDKLFKKLQEAKGMITLVIK